jgi:catechol 2,3-dioxygenase-like lactoylglutathione lyase family enzyme
MEQRISIVTLGVDNLVAMKQFYTEKFGWKIEAQAKDIAFFKLNGLLLGLYGRKDLATFTGKSPEGSGFRPLVIAYMVDSKAEVEELYNQFTSRGIEIVKEPSVPSIGGYYFLISDIEGNVWEIAWNPMMVLDKSGNVVAHTNIDHL